MFYPLEVCFDIKVVTKSWGKENSWMFGTCRSSKIYGWRKTYTENCCLIPGKHTLTCNDSFGDGWHDGYLEIQGKKYCRNFKNGEQKTIQFTVKKA